MHAIRLPNGNLLIPVEGDEPDAGVRVREIGPDHPEYGRWLDFAEAGEDPRPRQGGQPTLLHRLLERRAGDVAVLSGLLTGIMALCAGISHFGQPAVEFWPPLAVAGLTFCLLAFATWKK